MLATKKTIDSKLYQNSLSETGVNTVLPNEEDQDEISKTIVKILKRTVTREDRKKIKRIVDKLTEKGAECIVLACTDLQLTLKKNEFNIELIDSMEVLLESTFKILGGHSLKAEQSAPVEKPIGSGSNPDDPFIRKE